MNKDKVPFEFDKSVSSISFGSSFSTRDWFAGLALQGILLDPRNLLEASRKSSTPEYFIAEVAYKFADAMLAERKK